SLAHFGNMNTALLLLGVLGTTAALPDGFSTQQPPRNFSIQPRVPQFKLVWDGFSTQQPLRNFSIQPRVPQFKLPAFTPRLELQCKKKWVKHTLAPGDSVCISSPNYPSDYSSKSKCAWSIKSTTAITVTCSNFVLQPPNKKGKCKDRLILDGKKFCGTSLASYSGGTSIKAVFKSNRRKNYSGFKCTATAASGGGGGGGGGCGGGASGSCKCGQANRVSRIVNGVETEVNEYPWQAAMIYKGSTDVFCGGSVICSKHILTAAHCTQAVKDHGLKYQVLVGAHDLTSAAPSQLILNAQKYIQHKNYNSANQDNDIAIIVLENSIDFTSTQIRPVCLPESDADAYDSVTATVSGWGTLSSGGSQPDELQEVDVPTMSNNQCKNSYGSSITANMLCAGYNAGGKDSCQGDSGGPLTYNPGNGYILIGVVSWGNGCALAGYPGVNTRVTEYLSWISSNTGTSTTCPV
ncbi:unnamed protein product, partial [Meganyctiphanes norvegica]